ncbi:MAG TPA: hypothetical protein VEO54_29070 [Thermoanaerobaculia bacterium]|nr:hypothetical protein [Thermoanaerobaculia bacterium]
MDWLRLLLVTAALIVLALSSESGGGMDPNGCAGRSTTSAADDGTGIDPHGKR